MKYFLIIVILLLAGCSDCVRKGEYIIEDGQECCEDLSPKNEKEIYAANCTFFPNMGASLKQCIPCGDGVCGELENVCNCPEDCEFCMKTFTETGQCPDGCEKVIYDCIDEPDTDSVCAQCRPTDCYGLGEYVDTFSEDSFECCTGLSKIRVWGPYDEDCDSIIPEGSTGVEPGWTCLKCGDNECDTEYEDKCNCPDDCI